MNLTKAFLCFTVCVLVLSLTMGQVESYGLLGQVTGGVRDLTRTVGRTVGRTADTLSSK